jgi:hypothetical protein
MPHHKAEANTKSSSEDELVGVNDVISRHFSMHRDMESLIPLSIKTIRVQCYWRTAVVLAAVNVPFISIFGFSLQILSNTGYGC